MAAPGVDINAATSDGYTALGSASYKGHIEIVKMFLATPGINVNTVNAKGKTALMCAAKNGHKEIVRMLVAGPQKKIDLCDDEEDAVKYACRAAEVEVAMPLLGNTYL